MIKQLFILENGELQHHTQLREVTEKSCPSESKDPALIMGLLSALQNFAQLQQQDIEYIPFGNDIFFFYEERDHHFIIRSGSHATESQKDEYVNLLKHIAEYYFTSKEARFGDKAKHLMSDFSNIHMHLEA